jgi:Family of unknown function (DUF6582)
MDVEITEFEEIEPEEVHLVKRGANGFPPLLAKQVADEIAAAEAGEDLAADAAKAELDAKARNALDDSDFAYIDAKGGRHLPIHDAAHVRSALSRFNQTQFDNAADKKTTAKKLIAAAKKFDIDVSEDTAVDDAAKAAYEAGWDLPLVEKDGIISGPNPMFGTPAAADDSQVPGSPTWEASDADTAAQAAQALMQAAECIRCFAAREGAEVAAGEGSDLIDEFDAMMALDAVTCALGIMARLAFLEGAEAAKAGDATKAGKRNSTRDLAALRAARDHLNSVIGDADGNTKSDGEDAAEKAEGEILAMTKDELIALLDERDSRKAEARKTAKAEAKKAAADKTAADKAEKAAAKADAEAELTDEERAAQKAARDEKKAAKTAAKEAKKSEKIQAAARAAAEEVGETVKSVGETLRSLSDRLSTVEKMAAPGGPAKTRTPADMKKAAERDELLIERDRVTRQLETTAVQTDTTLKKGYQERLRGIDEKLAAL